MAAAEHDHRERLEALRDALRTRLDSASDRDFAALAARYQSVLAELATMADPNAAADDVESAQAAAEAVLRLVQ
jgi:hypothetical protein